MRQRIGQRLRAAISLENWDEAAETLLAEAPAGLAGALMACLPLGGREAERAARLLARHMAALALSAERLEQARNLMRQLLWRMNDESGNVGWGVPLALGEIMAASPRLANEFHRILLSYVRRMAGPTNYCDYAPLRVSCYAAIGRLAEARPEFRKISISVLRDAGQAETDDACRDAAEKTLRAVLSAEAGATERAE